MSNESHISFYLPTFRIHIFGKAIADIGNPQFIRFLIKDDCTSMAMEAYCRRNCRNDIAIPNLMQLFASIFPFDSKMYY